MLTEICAYLKNWFDRKPDGSEFPKYAGTVTVKDGSLAIDGKPVPLLSGQCFRVLGSVFNDGVHTQGSGSLKDEVFDGEVWAMAVPPDVLSISNEIEEWQRKYGSTESAAMSPFASESFGGYSYTKSSGQTYASGSQSTPSSWKTMYGTRLSRYKKL